MDLIEGSETSANINQTLGIHPKIETVNTEHSESLKSRIIHGLLPGGLRARVGTWAGRYSWQSVPRRGEACLDVA
jgi:hypothetical protein